MFLLADDILKLSEKQSSVEINHSRSSVRYVRKDLKTYLTNYGFLRSGHLRTTLTDISSGGVKVVASNKLRVNKALTVNICFLDGYKFEIKGKIVRVNVEYSYLYDLKYETINSDVDSQKSTFSRVFIFADAQFLKSQYRNITSDTVQILASERINKNQKIRLVFEFLDGEMIERNVKVTRFKKLTKYHYGIEFERKNHMLGNYLLKTQKSLVFAH